MRIEDLDVVTLALDVAKRPRDEPLLGVHEYVVVPDGQVESKNGKFRLDAAGAQSIVAEFDSHGTKLPVDYEHHTLGGEHASPTGQAEAAGWITALRYEKGKGLLATIHWLARAADQIRTTAYRYLSPVLVLDKKTRRVIALHSAALTNKPAIPRMPDLLQAASDGLIRRLQAMAEDPQEKETGQSVDTLIVSIRELLSLPEDAAPEDVLQAAFEALKAGSAAEGESVAASVAKALKLADGADQATILAAVTKLQDGTVDKQAHTEVADQLGVLQTEHESVVERLVLTEAKGLVEQFSDAGKLTEATAKLHLGRLTEGCNTLDEFAARKQGFIELMEASPAIIPQGQTAPPKSMGPADRQIVINKAAGEYDGNPDHHCTAKVDFIALALREAKMPRLSDEEQSKFEVATV